MRGEDPRQPALFSYVSQEERIPSDHPLRAIRKMTDEVLVALRGRLSKLYSHTGRPSIPPEQLLRALLLQVMYSIRSERLMMEQLEYNLLFRWFVGLSMDDAVWVPTVFTKNRDRLLKGEIAQAFFGQVLQLARQSKLLSDEHFTVDGTLIEAWASHKSFKRKDAPAQDAGDDDGSNPTVDFRGEKRCNKTHQSTSDPQSRLYRKGPGKEAKLCFMGHVLMENRHGLAIKAALSEASGTAERDTALELAESIPDQSTLGADKGYDTKEFVAALRELKVTPHVAQNISGRASAIDRRTTRHHGYEVSQRKRKLVEQIVGWLKTIGLMRKTRHKGRDRVGWMFIFSVAIYNLIRMKNLKVKTT